MARKLVLVALAILVPGGIIALILAWLGARSSLGMRLRLGAARRLALAGPDLLGRDLGAAPTATSARPR